MHEDYKQLLKNDIDIVKSETTISTPNTLLGLSVPQYNAKDERDDEREALAILQNYYPKHKVESLVNNFSDDDLLNAIEIPKSVDPRLIAELLLHYDGFVITTASGTSPKDTPDDFRFLISNKAIRQMQSDSDKNSKDGIDPKLVEIFKQLDIQQVALTLSEVKKYNSILIADTRQKSYEVFKERLNDFNYTRDKINFLNFLCAQQTNSPEARILKQMLDTRLTNIIHAKTHEQRDDEINKFMKSVIYNPDVIQNKIKRYVSLGVLKFSKPPKMEVFLSDDRVTDFFELDKNTNYQIMNSINVTKANMPMNFSNCAIHGDFVCNRAKKQILLPNQIHGVLSCTYCGSAFLKNTKIPNGTLGILAEGTITNIDDLLSIDFPQTVEEISVLPSMINSILKNPDETEKFKTFVNKYPNIKILDAACRICLQDALAQRENAEKQKAQTEQKPEKPQVAAEHVLPEKTAEWLSRKEIVSICKQDAAFADIDLERLVKRATNNNAQIKSQEMSYNGVSVYCVHTDNFDIVKTRMLEIVAEDQNRANQTKTVTQEKTVTTDKTAKSRKPKTIRIAKYIQKSVWKDLCSAMNDNKQLLLSVLETISLLNMDYTTQTARELVIYIDKNGTEQSLSKVKIKTNRAIAQSPESNDNRRIVWTLNPVDKVLVAIAFFKQHDRGRESIDYTDVAIPNAAKGFLMDGKTVVDKQLVTSDDYLNVKDLLKNLQEELGQKNTQTKRKTKQKPRIEQPKTEKKVADTTQDNISEANTVSALDPAPANTTVVMTKKIDLDSICLPAPACFQRRHIDSHKTSLVDVTAASAEIDEIIARINKEILAKTVDLIENENNPEIQLIILKQINSLVRKKMSPER